MFSVSLFVHASQNHFIADVKAEQNTLSAPQQFQSLLIIDLGSYLEALLGLTYKTEVKKWVWGNHWIASSPSSLFILGTFKN